MTEPAGGMTGRADTIFRALVTGEEEALVAFNQRTSFYANWLGSRERRGRETYLVTVFAAERDVFLDHARRTEGITVEELHGALLHESYELLVGEAGTGWAEA